MRLLDRLDAIDRRLSRGQREPMRPPRRWGRWIAEHRWETALLHAFVFAAVWVSIFLFSGGDVSLAVALMQVAAGFALGFLSALMARNACEAWDRRAQEPGRPEIPPVR